MHKIDQPAYEKNHSTDLSSDSWERWWTDLEPPILCNFHILFIINKHNSMQISHWLGVRR